MIDDTVLDSLVRVRPADVAVAAVGKGTTTRVSRRELATMIQEATDLLRRHGRQDGRLLVVQASNTARTLALSCAAWRSGVAVVLVDPKAPRPVVERRIQRSPWRDRPVLFAGEMEATKEARASEHAPLDERFGPIGPTSVLPRRARSDPDPLGAAADPPFLLATGGSTGEPRLVPSIPGLHPALFESYFGLLRQTNWSPDQRQLVSGPLYHAAPALHAFAGLVAGNRLVLLDHFDPGVFCEVVAGHGIDWCQLTPYQMQRIAACRAVHGADLGSLRGVLHTAAPCPSSVKRRWIELVGAPRLFEIYSSSEAIGVTLVGGPEWLTRPGTVGRGYATQVRILDEDARQVPAGTVGVVYMRSSRTDVVRRLASSGLVQVAGGGFAAVGDRGWMDAEGYLYLSGRTDDVVNVGGAKVDAAEVQAVLASHEGVRDVVVHPVPNRRLGQRMAAWVIVDDRSVGPAELRSWCRSRLPRPAQPQIHVVARFPRTAAGKIDFAGLQAGGPERPGQSGGQGRETVTPDLSDGPR